MNAVLLLVLMITVTAQGAFNLTSAPVPTIHETFVQITRHKPRKFIWI
jgi:hypothetical protein